MGGTLHWLRNISVALIALSCVQPLLAGDDILILKNGELHLAGDDKRPLTVGERRISTEEVQAERTTHTSGSASARPQVSKATPSKPKVDQELTDAPLE